MKKLLKNIIKAAIILIVVCIIILGVVTGIVYYYQDSMIFNQQKFPPGKIYEHPSKYETILFTTDEGYKYKCWYSETEDTTNAATIFYVIGNGAFKEEYVKTINFYNFYIGVNMFICSTRGSGDYEGKPNEELLYKDAALFFRYINKRVNKKALFIHGRSMGGAVALHTALQNEKYVNGLILENTFTSIPDIAREVHPILSYFLIGFVYLIKTQMDNKSKIQKFKKPVLFLISEKDRVVNPNHMHKLYDKSISQNKFKFVNPMGNHHSVEIGKETEFVRTYTDFVSKFNTERNIDLSDKSDDKLDNVESSKEQILKPKNEEAKNLRS